MGNSGGTALVPAFVPRRISVKKQPLHYGKKDDPGQGVGQDEPISQAFCPLLIGNADHVNVPAAVAALVIQRLRADLRQEVVCSSPFGAGWFRTTLVRSHFG
jgi:hypothetical protein